MRTQRRLMITPPQNQMSNHLTLMATCQGQENGTTSTPPRIRGWRSRGGSEGRPSGDRGRGGRRFIPGPSPVLRPGTNGSMRGIPHGPDQSGRVDGEIESYM